MNSKYVIVKRDNLDLIVIKQYLDEVERGIEEMD